MAMVVKNNMTAINTLNTLNKNSSALSKSLQKVSSGMKINSAADDASGYAISERMRVQIRSLDQANQNTQNGSSMMKVAEGAVSSTVEILKTLKEKAVNAANDSNTDSDRQTIQKELDQSIDQINDNANVTFNGKYLVDGSKNSKGNATYTALSNQSLAKDTKATTALTDLTARNGDSLEIRDTDKVTVSYVQAGKTYSTTFQVKDEKTGNIATLQDIFSKAEDIDNKSQIFATLANGSVSKAALEDGTTTEDAVNTAKGSAETNANNYYAAVDKLDEKTKDLGDLDDSSSVAGKTKKQVDDWNSAVSAYKEALARANTTATDTSTTTSIAIDSTIKDSGAYMDAVASNTSYQTIAGTLTNAGGKGAQGGVTGIEAALGTDVSAKTSSAEIATEYKNALNGGTDLEKDIKTALDAIAGSTTNMAEANQKMREVMTAGLGLANAAKALNDGTIATQITKNGTAKADSEYAKYADAKTEYNAAKAAYDKSGKPQLLTGKTVGVAGSDDLVTTASGENAITITANTAGVGGQISGLNISITDSQGNVKKSANSALDSFEETIRAQNKSEDNAISLQVGAKANQSIKVGLTDMRAEALGLQGSDGTKLNISTQNKANAAINVLDNAIQKALDQQTTIGSVESRLEYTSSNLTTASENVQASESTIRDADMAKEMTNYTKNNVLLQAAQSMLAQANQSSSNVLSLLQ